MKGPDKQTDCWQQPNNSWLPPPPRIHKKQEVPQIAQKNSRGKFLHQSEGENFPKKISPRNCLRTKIPPLYLSAAGGGGGCDGIVGASGAQTSQTGRVQSTNIANRRGFIAQRSQTVGGVEAEDRNHKQGGGGRVQSTRVTPKSEIGGCCLVRKGGMQTGAPMTEGSGGEQGRLCLGWICWGSQSTQITNRGWQQYGNPKWVMFTMQKQTGGSRAQKSQTGGAGVQSTENTNIGGQGGQSTETGNRGGGVESRENTDTGGPENTNKGRGRAQKSKLGWGSRAQKRHTRGRWDPEPRNHQQRC